MLDATARTSERIRTKGAKRVEALTIETTVFVSTSFLSDGRESRGNAPLSSGVPWVDLTLVLASSETRAQSDSETDPNRVRCVVIAPPRRLKSDDPARMETI